MVKEILEKLKEIRQEKGYTTEEISKYLHIEKSSYEKVENGTNDSWHKYFFLLLTKYEYEPDDFFRELKGKNFIHQENNQENKDSATGSINGLVEKILVNDHTNVIELYEKRIHDKDEMIRIVRESEENYKSKYYRAKEKLKDAEVKVKELEVMMKNIQSKLN